MVTSRNELVILVIGYLIDTSSASYRAIAWAQVDLDMHHVMFLNVLGIVVLCAVKYQITWLHLVKV